MAGKEKGHCHAGACGSGVRGPHPVSTRALTLALSQLPRTSCGIRHGPHSPLLPLFLESLGTARPPLRRAVPSLRARPSPVSCPSPGPTLSLARQPPVSLVESRFLYQSPQLERKFNERTHAYVFHWFDVPVHNEYFFERTNRSRHFSSPFSYPEKGDTVVLRPGTEASSSSCAVRERSSRAPDSRPSHPKSRAFNVGVPYLPVTATHTQGSLPGRAPGKKGSALRGQSLGCPWDVALSLRRPNPSLAGWTGPSQVLRQSFLALRQGSSSSALRLTPASARRPS